MLEHLGKFLTTKEVCEMAGVSRQQLYMDVQSGIIKCYKFGQVASRFKESDAIKYAEGKIKYGRKRKID